MDRLTSPNYTNPNESIDKTCAIIKPNGMHACDEIVQRIIRAGFKIVQSRILKLTVEQATEFYKNLYGTKDFSLFVSNICGGPIRVMCIAKPKAIEEFKALMGMSTISLNQPVSKMQCWPGSLGAYYESMGIEAVHAIHGSNDSNAAEFEIHFFFPNLRLEAKFPTPIIENYLSLNIYQILMDGIFEAGKRRPTEPIIFLANWLLQHNPNKPIINEIDPEIKHYDSIFQKCLPTIVEDIENIN